MFPDTLSHTLVRDKAKVWRKERKHNWQNRMRERKREGENENETEKLRGERGKEERESLCELAHNGNAKVNSLPGRKSTVGHLGNRMCILNVSQGLYVWIVYDILLAFLFPFSFHYSGIPPLPRCPLSFYSPPFSTAPAQHYHSSSFNSTKTSAVSGFVDRTKRTRETKTKSATTTGQENFIQRDIT